LAVHGLECLGQFQCGSIAAVFILGQGVLDYRVEFRRQIRPEMTWGHGIHGGDLMHDRERAWPPEWQQAGGCLIQHAAQRKNIRAAIQRLATGLFGRHVRDGAYQHAGRRACCFHGPCINIRAGADAFHQFGDSKTQDFDLRLGRHDDIGRLDIAVDDAGPVRCP
jgi:hypothetical protein